jgi:hypothetical protein
MGLKRKKGMSPWICGISYFFFRGLEQPLNKSMCIRLATPIINTEFKHRLDKSDKHCFRLPRYCRIFQHLREIKYILLNSSLCLIAIFVLICSR